jgi:hypothetical protein
MKTDHVAGAHYSDATSTMPAPITGGEADFYSLQNNSHVAGMQILQEHKSALHSRHPWRFTEHRVKQLVR